MSIESYKALQELMSKVDTPSEAVLLPSEEGVYDPDIIELNDEGKVLVHPMISADEAIFSSAEAYTTGSGILELLKRRVEGCKQPEKLFEPDVIFLVAAIRALTFGSIYHVDVRCAGCGNEFEFDVDSNNLPVKRFGKDDVESEITLSNGQVVKTTHLPFQVLSKLARTDDVDLGYVSRIMSVDGIEDRFAIGEWFKKIPLKLKKELKQHLSQPLGGFDQTTKAECPRCGFENQAEVSLLAGFFFNLLKE